MAKTLEGYLLIADITGYTMYLSESELEHAQEILSALLELLLDHTRPPLVLSRLAGDAVISYGLRENFYQGQTFLETIEDTYVAFRRAIEQMVRNNTCGCRACANISHLDLKFFIHYGSFGIQRIVDHDELVGSDVNLIHRLLKNHVFEKTGFPSYTLFTSAAVDHLAMPGLCDTLVPLEEEYEHLGVVKVWVKNMHPVWEEKRAAARISIPAAQLLFHVEAEIALTPEQVWDYLIRPEFRNTLIGSERQDVAHLSHGRVVKGSVYQCIHSNHTIPLTILEWQPFESIVMHSTMPPLRGASVLMELRLEQTSLGTRLTHSISKTRGPLPIRLAGDIALRRMVKQSQAEIEAFRAQVEADAAKRGETATLAVVG